MFEKLGPFLSTYIFAATAFILLYLYVTRKFNYWRDRNVPYAKPIPFFGNAFQFSIQKASVNVLLEEFYTSTKSPYFGFFVFDQPFLLIRDPDLIKTILIKDFDHFENRSVVANLRDDLVSSNILFILKNPSWKPLRTKLTSVFTTGKMKNMLPLVVSSSVDMTEYLNKVASKEKSSDCREIVMKFTTDVIANCAFGIKANCFKYEDAEFRKTSRHLFGITVNRKFQMLCFFFAPFLVDLFKMTFFESKSVNFLSDVFWRTLHERETSKKFRGDLIDILIELRKQDDSSVNLDGDVLIAQALQFFAAGFETTGSTISFTLYELAGKTEVQDRLRSEIQDTLEKHGGITYYAINEMTYLDMVVSEALRKYPPLPFLDRRCSKPFKIPGTDVIIEKGIPIYISLRGLHYDPEFFPNPEEFDPERFSFVNKGSISNFSYMPFGNGPRSCIGERFGLLATKVALISILKEFAVELCEDSPVPLKLHPTSIMLSPEKELNLRFRRGV